MSNVPMLTFEQFWNENLKMLLIFKNCEMITSNVGIKKLRLGKIKYQRESNSGISCYQKFNQKTIIGNINECNNYITHKLIRKLLFANKLILCVNIFNKIIIIN